MKTAIAPQMTYPRANTLTTVGETSRLNRYRIINAANAMPIYEPQTIGSTFRRCLMSSICCGVPCFMSLDYKAASANAKIKLRNVRGVRPRFLPYPALPESCSPAQLSCRPAAGLRALWRRCGHGGSRRAWFAARSAVIQYFNPYSFVPSSGSAASTA